MATRKKGAASSTGKTPTAIQTPKESPPLPDTPPANTLIFDLSQLMIRAENTYHDAVNAFIDSSYQDLSVQSSPQAQQWGQFLKKNSHLLSLATPSWPVSKILIQLALEQPNDSIIRSTMVDWFAKNPLPQTILFHRRNTLNNTSSEVKDPLLVSFVGHDHDIVGVLLSPSGFLLSYSKHEVIAWDSKQGIAVWIVKDIESVESVTPLGSNLVVTSGIGPRIIDTRTGQILAKLEINANEHPGDLPLDLGGNRFLTFSHMINLWDYSGKHLGQLPSAGDWTTGRIALDNSRVLAWGRKGNKARLIDTTNFKDLGEIGSHRDEVNAACLLSNGNILTAAEDKTIKEWDLKKKKVVTTIKTAEKYNCEIRQLPDGRILLWCSGGRFQLWDWATQTLVRESRNYIERAFWQSPLSMFSQGEHLMYWDLDASPDPEVLDQKNWEWRVACELPNKRLACAGDKKPITIWDMATKKPLASLGPIADSPKGLFVLPEGNLVSYGERFIKIWDTTAAAPIGESNETAAPTHTVQAVTYCKLGKLIEYSDGSIEFRKADGAIVPIPCENNDVSTAISESGKLFVSSSKNVTVWDLSTGQLQATIEDNDDPTTLELADGRFITADGKRITFWDQQGKGIKDINIDGKISGITELEPDKVIAWTDKRVYVLDTVQQKTLAKIDAPGFSIMQGLVVPDRSFFTAKPKDMKKAFESDSPEQTLKISTSSNKAMGLKNGSVLVFENTLSIYDPHTQSNTVVACQHSGRATSAVELPNNQLILGFQDGCIEWIDTNTSTTIAEFNGHKESVWGVSLCAKNRFVSYDYTGVVCIWDLTTKTRIAQVHLNAQPKAVETPTNDTLLCWGNEKTSLELYSLDDGSEIASLKSGAGKIEGYTILDDGRIVSWNERTTHCTVWNGKTGAQLGELGETASEIKGAKQTHSGKIVTFGKDGAMRAYDSKKYCLLGKVDGVDGTAELSHEIQPDLLLCIYSASASCFVLVDLREYVITTNTCWLDHGGVQLSKILPDGKLLTVTSHATIRVWDILTGELVADYHGHKEYIWDAWEPHVGVVLTYGHDKTIRLWGPPLPHTVVLPRVTRVKADGTVVPQRDPTRRNQKRVVILSGSVSVYEDTLDGKLLHRWVTEGEPRLINFADDGSIELLHNQEVFTLAIAD